MAFSRKPPSGNVRRVRCLGHNLRGVTTNKCGHLVQFESELEHTLILLFERDRSIADYRSQPEVLSFRDATGRSRTYTPDFKVWRTDGRMELHEVSVETRRQHREALRQCETAAPPLDRVLSPRQTLPPWLALGPVALAFLAGGAAFLLGHAPLILCAELSVTNP
ncbi:MAG: Tn7 transposase TnsA N-terminal domain-containing protein [Chloroflexota bacterium]|nr:Tn7 transposase TnsA N-terminal domain-containing protein [Chloroflexota bacterium]